VRIVLTAFVLGAAAVFAALLVGGVALGIAAQSRHWQTIHVGIGPVEVFHFVRAGRTTTTTFGNGLGLAALAGGALNAAGAAYLRARPARG
jgi:hypothetical protein